MNAIGLRFSGIEIHGSVSVSKDSTMKNLQLNTIVSTSELADLLMMSPRRVAQLAEIGAITKHSRGKFLVSEAVPSYLEFLRDPSCRRLILTAARGIELSDFDD